MTDCELLVIARHSFLPLLERPVMTRELLNVLCERLRRTSEQVEDVLFLDLEARIAKTLVVSRKTAVHRSRVRALSAACRSANSAILLARRAKK
jgi:CRP/FNR family transcriptional regulator, cyclic AMP receptor protein